MNALLVAALTVAAPAVAETCVARGQWLDRLGRPLAAAEAVRLAGAADVVLLGERHAVPSHHRWQADTIAALAATGRRIVIGLEQLPRSAQPALDDLVAGRIGIDAFRAQSQWDKLWGHDFEAYRPIFELAVAKRLPIQALNVDRAFVRAVGKEGFTAAAASGAPIGRPAPASAAYAASLEAVFRSHAKAPSAQVIANFIEAQTVWDRAMAEGLAAALAGNPGAIAFGLMGYGHVRDGHGVAHQLAAIGSKRVYSAIAVAGDKPCDPPPAAADALFGAD